MSYKNYPHLKIARFYGLPYSTVLLFADVLRRAVLQDSDVKSVTSNQHEIVALTQVMSRPDYNPFAIEVMEAMGYHWDQQRGRRGMDGELLAAAGA